MQDKEKQDDKIELRWYQSVDDGSYKLQYRYGHKHGINDNEWIDVPFVLEGVGVSD